MKTEIKIHAEELAQALRDRVEEYAGRGHAAVARGCQVLVGEAKRRAPSDTGLLRQSITYRVINRNGEVVGQVGTNVHYAIHVEFGHRTRLGTGSKASKLRTGVFSEPLKRKRRGQSRRSPRKATETRATMHFVPGVFFLKGAMTAKRESVQRIVAQRLRKEGNGNDG